MTNEDIRCFELTCEARDNPDLEAPRKCHLLAKVSAPGRDDYWLAEVRPPFRGQLFGLGGLDISEVIIATRLKGHSLFDSGRAATPVYVARILDAKVIATKSLTPDQIELILWCDARPAG